MYNSPMRIGIISDIHANLPALESIIKYFRRNHVERIIHLGDAIGMGPFPCETLDYMKTLDNCEMILGNHENDFLKKSPGNINEDVVKHNIWVHSLLNEKHSDWIKTFPKIIYEEYKGRKFAFLHCIYENEIDDFTPYADVPIFQIEKLEDYFKDIDSNTIFFGHTHFRQFNAGFKKEYCNPGPRRKKKHNETGFMILTVNEKEYKIEIVNIEYNKKHLLEEFYIKDVSGKENIIKFFFS
jgi:putative phosphoesterase